MDAIVKTESGRHPVIVVGVVVVQVAIRVNVREVAATGNAQPTGAIHTDRA